MSNMHSAAPQQSKAQLPLAGPHDQCKTQFYLCPACGIGFKPQPSPSNVRDTCYYHALPCTLLPCLAASAYDSQSSARVPESFWNHPHGLHEPSSGCARATTKPPVMALPAHKPSLQKLKETPHITFLRALHSARRGTLCAPRCKRKTALQHMENTTCTGRNSPKMPSYLYPRVTANSKHPNSSTASYPLKSW